MIPKIDKKFIFNILQKHKRQVSTSTASLIGTKVSTKPYLMPIVFICVIVAKVVIRKFDLTHLYLGNSAVVYSLISHMTTNFEMFSFYDVERGGF